MCCGPPLLSAAAVGSPQEHSQQGASGSVHVYTYGTLPRHDQRLLSASLQSPGAGPSKIRAHSQSPSTRTLTPRKRGIAIFPSSTSKSQQRAARHDKENFPSGSHPALGAFNTAASPNPTGSKLNEKPDVTCSKRLGESNSAEVINANDSARHTGVTTTTTNTTTTTTTMMTAIDSPKTKDGDLRPPSPTPPRASIRQMDHYPFMAQQRDDVFKYTATSSAEKAGPTYNSSNPFWEKPDAHGVGAKNVSADATAFRSPRIDLRTSTSVDDGSEVAGQLEQIDHPDITRAANKNDDGLAEETKNTVVSPIDLSLVGNASKKVLKRPREAVVQADTEAGGAAGRDLVNDSVVDELGGISKRPKTDADLTAKGFGFTSSSQPLPDTHSDASPNPNSGGASASAKAQGTANVKKEEEDVFGRVESVSANLASLNSKSSSISIASIKVASSRAAVETETLNGPPPRVPAKRIVDLTDAIQAREAKEAMQKAREDKRKQQEVEANAMQSQDIVDASHAIVEQESPRQPNEDAERAQDIDMDDPPVNNEAAEIAQSIDAEVLYDHHMAHRDAQERIEIVADVQKIYSKLPDLKFEYRIVDRLGEGTFSSVYKAIDVWNHLSDNRQWHDPSTDQEIVLAQRDHPQRRTHKLTYVALKRIYVTSSPERVQNELELMEELKGARNIGQLITAFRREDQVIAVMPYHPNDDFRLFYKHLDPPMIRKYLRSLLRALDSCHRRGIIHRDVKPANFLFDYGKATGVLVDFGLAERYEPTTRTACQHSAATYIQPHGVKHSAVTDKVEQAVYDARKRVASGRVGFPANDTRPTTKANRAGTRGFRAPEVLLKCPDQTVAIDIWAAGVILLSILCQKFPVFNAGDDVESLLELAAVFGKQGMEKAAMLHNRTILSNLTSIPHTAKSLADIVMMMNPRLYEPPAHNATPEEARRHILLVDSCLDLLKRLLHVDSTKRITAKNALLHPFLNGLEQAEDCDGIAPDDLEVDELIRNIGEGSCGKLHRMTKSGQHVAKIDGKERLMGWGQGRAIGSRPCPYHTTGWKPRVSPGLIYQSSTSISHAE